MASPLTAVDRIRLVPGTRVHATNQALRYAILVEDIRVEKVARRVASIVRVPVREMIVVMSVARGSALSGIESRLERRRAYVGVLAGGGVERSINSALQFCRAIILVDAGGGERLAIIPVRTRDCDFEAVAPLALVRRSSRGNWKAVEGAFDVRCRGRVGTRFGIGGEGRVALEVEIESDTAVLRVAVFGTERRIVAVNGSQAKVTNLLDTRLKVRECLAIARWSGSAVSGHRIGLIVAKCGSCIRVSCQDTSSAFSLAHGSIAHVDGETYPAGCSAVGHIGAPSVRLTLALGTAVARTWDEAAATAEVRS